MTILNKGVNSWNWCLSGMNLEGLRGPSDEEELVERFAEERSHCRGLGIK